MHLILAALTCKDPFVLYMVLDRYLLEPCSQSFSLVGHIQMTNGIKPNGQSITNWQTFEASSNLL